MESFLLALAFQVSGPKCVLFSQRENIYVSLLHGQTAASRQTKSPGHLHSHQGPCYLSQVHRGPFGKPQTVEEFREAATLFSEDFLIARMPRICPHPRGLRLFCPPTADLLNRFLPVLAQALWGPPRSPAASLADSA